MSWLVLGLLAAGSLLLMRLAGIRGAMLQLAGAALMFGAAGYALQGRPGLVGSPRNSADAAWASTTSLPSSSPPT